MTRSIPTAAVLLVLFSITRVSAADSAAPFPHIRSNQSALLEAVDQASRASATFRQLAERLSASDVIVYLHYRMAGEPGLAGATSFMSAAGGLRYLRVSIDPRLLGCQRLALLGHELQHAVEIAAAPSVVDQQSLEALYRSVGFRSPAACARCFESADAIAAGRRIQREVLTRRRDAATR
jgi:hypothetical protein